MRVLPTGKRRAFVRAGPALAFLLGACSSAPRPAGLAPPHLSELEAAVSGAEAGPDARIRLAAAYLHAERSADAARTLEGVVQAPQAPVAASYFLGLAYENLKRYPDARRQYRVVLEAAGAGASANIRRTVRGRLAALDRLELEQAVRVALQQERSVGTTPSQGTVGVFPFLNAAAPSLSPLGRALAELLTLDLGITNRLTVVERAQLQRVLDELRLAQSGAVNVEGAARAGRLLGAGRIVQGRLDGSEGALRIQALVVPVSSAVAGAPINQSGPVTDLLAMQNNLSLEIYASLGVELTIAERELVLGKPTQNVQALLAFGLGLEAEDASRFLDAADQYRSALRIDPDFREAALALERAQAKADAENDTEEVLLEEGVREFAIDIVRAAQIRDRVAGIESIMSDPGRRDAVADVLGTEGLERRGLFDLIVRRPR